jgi:hypothetical protein
MAAPVGSAQRYTLIRFVNSASIVVTASIQYIQPTCTNYKIYDDSCVHVLDVCVPNFELSALFFTTRRLRQSHNAAVTRIHVRNVSY